MTDDFSGKISPAWLEVGERAEKLKIIPKGDETYPLLSMADILMEYIKQEVDDWDEKEIYEHLRQYTPDKSGWVDSDGIQTDKELKRIAPAYRTTINTAPYYPSPTLYLDTGGKFSSDVVTSLDFYDYALGFARKHGGCVKFFDENQDRDYITGNDYLICLDGDGAQYSYFQDMNATRVPEVLSLNEATELFQDDIDAY
jgi:hypothetical protein